MSDKEFCFAICAGWLSVLWLGFMCLSYEADVSNRRGNHMLIMAKCVKTSSLVRVLEIKTDRVIAQAELLDSIYGRMRGYDDGRTSTGARP